MMNFFRKRLNKKGFTLVELLIVIAVLGILAGIGVNSMGGITKTFKERADVENAKMVARQIEVNIMAGTLTVGTSGLANDAIDDKVTYPAAQSIKGGDFNFAVDTDGYVTVTVVKTGETTLTLTDKDADTDTKPTIKIATKKVE